jgi:predicted SprT family Zn-dependent metalloprotease
MQSVDLMQYEEDKFYNIQEAYALYKCANDCPDLADFTIQRSDGNEIHVCAECRTKMGWL